MLINHLKIKGIPAVLWGEKRSSIIIAAYGSHSSKIDDCIRILAEEAVPLGFQVLSLDFPAHGERKDEPGPRMIQQCVEELKTVMRFARQKAEQVSIFGCSMGAYFSLLAYEEEPIEHALFLSPVTDMERIIHNIMEQFDITEEKLRQEKTVVNPVETLYWDYYCYVKEHPVVSWTHPTSILYGEHDAMCEFSYVSAFARKYHCNLEVHKGGEHWFHTADELEYYRAWLKRTICNK